MLGIQLSCLFLTCSRTVSCFDFLVGVILPFENPEAPWVLNRGAKAALEIAAETITESDYLLVNSTLSLIYTDSSCSYITATLGGLQLYLEYAPHLYVGPACTFAVYQFAQYPQFWNVPEVRLHLFIFV